MREIHGTTRLLGVIGWPVAHSFSPAMQNAALAALGLDWVYVPLAIAPADLTTAIAGLRAAGFVGFNATIPHKQALVPLMDQLTDVARLTGTVNTVHFTERGIVGDSTDGPGFVAAARAAGCFIKDARVVVIGAGGAARAVAVALAQRGIAALTILNRTPERAADLARLVNDGVRPGLATFLSLSDESAQPALRAADLIVNATSVGMHPNEDAQPLELPADLRGKHLVDLIYNPPQTRLMAQAAARGATVSNGIGLLCHQGALSLARWTGRQAPIATMESALGAELARLADLG